MITRYRDGGVRTLDVAHDEPLVHDELVRRPLARGRREAHSPAQALLVRRQAWDGARDEEGGKEISDGQEIGEGQRRLNCG